jgi:hypothetical protein
MSFFKSILTHPELKRGASHLAVGALIGLVSTLLTRERVGTDAE